MSSIVEVTRCHALVEGCYKWLSVARCFLCCHVATRVLSWLDKGLLQELECYRRSSVATITLLATEAAIVVAADRR